MSEKVLPTISEQTFHELSHLRTSNPPLFHQHIEMLLQVGWPLRAIAVPFSVSNTTVATWASKGEHDVPVGPLEHLPDSLPRSLNSRYRKTNISPEQSARLKELSLLARKVRQNTPQNSPYRAASKELDTLLKDLNQSGVSIERLALEYGVSRGAIVRRLKKED